VSTRPNLTPLRANQNGKINECTVDVAYDLNNPGITNCRTGTPQEIFKNYPNDYRLGSSSPAFNAGPKVNPALYPSVDLDGRPRVQGGKIDHGCYEANPPGTLLLLR